jgi:hypothetical protein
MVVTLGTKKRTAILDELDGFVSSDPEEESKRRGVLTKPNEKLQN